MRSSSSPSRLVATIVALGVTNTLVAAWIWRRRNHWDNDSQANANANANPIREKETKESSSSSPKARDDDGLSEVIVSLVPPFPWESSKLSNGGSGGSTHTNPLHPSKKISPSEAVQQLEFLSNMTFANGGLRAPNCPCCV